MAKKIPDQRKVRPRQYEQTGDNSYEKIKQGFLALIMNPCFFLGCVIGGLLGYILYGPIVFH